MMERVARNFHLLHCLQAQAQLKELNLDKQLIAARRSGTAHFIERRSLLYQVVRLARRANRGAEQSAFTRTQSGPSRLENCPWEIEEHYYVQDVRSQDMQERIARKFYLLHSKQVELAKFMQINELSAKSRLGWAMGRRCIFKWQRTSIHLCCLPDLRAVYLTCIVFFLIFDLDLEACFGSIIRCHIPAAVTWKESLRPSSDSNEDKSQRSGKWHCR